MDLYEAIHIATFIMMTIAMISYYINTELPKVCDVLQLMNILPCYEIKAFRDGKRLNYSDLIKYINRPVKGHQLKNGVLYIEIY